MYRMSMRERSGIGWAMDKAKSLVREVAGIVEGNEETKAEGCLGREEAAGRKRAYFRNSYKETNRRSGGGS
jgi:hypothetical protein